ncbi:beta strand repeat-containing protein [Mesorhizobium sp. L-8-3]|uniref:beta strand repeat-containing protein n=1 Tax=Mesorhizobium sp. L-8-3 TaxID=2744522 RepID=UPI00237B8BCA|nr:calcium-binding protein [Mesorhizobium sp. L-8-3]
MANNIQGTPGDDVLVGTSADDVILGLQGEDVISGGEGNDTLDGGSGTDDDDNDLYDILDYMQDGGSQGVVVDLAAGTATDSYGDTDTITEFEGVVDTNLADTIIGSDNDESYFVNGGADVIDGAGGFDELNYHLADQYGGNAVGIVVTFNNDMSGIGGGTVVDPFGDTDTFANIEAIRGTRYADTMTGGLGDQRFRGLDGADVIDGGSDYDTVDYRRDANYGGLNGIDADLEDVDGEGFGRILDGFGAEDRVRNVEQIRGSEFGDAIRGDAGANDFRGEGGNDLLDGRDGDDLLRGGAGDDILAGGGGFDFIAGGEGMDVLVLQGSSTDYSITSNGDGTYTVTDHGGNGDDQDVVSEIELVEFSNGSIAFGLLAGIEGLHGTEADDNPLTGTANADALFGHAGNDAIYGMEDEDVIAGGAGDDIIDGGSGTSDDENGVYDAVDYMQDAAEGGTQGVVVNLATGVATDPFGDTDTLIEIERVFGTNFADSITGSDQDELFDPHGGADTIDGGDGWDEVTYHHSQWHGGTGGITVTFDDGTANTTDGSIVDPYGDVDHFTNIEAVRGTNQVDVMTGGLGTQRFRALAGADVLDGGADVDMLDYRRDINTGGEEGIDADLEDIDAEGYARIKDGFGDYDRVRNIEQIRGTGFDDAIRGDGIDNLLQGEGGADFLSGRHGDDVLHGGLGDDVLVGGSGADVLDGGAGADIADYAGSNSAVTVNLTTGSGVGGDAAGDTLIAIEQVVGSAFDDTLAGDGAANVLDGSGGNDLLNGGAGIDQMSGGLGDDRFYVDSASDRVFEASGQGNDAVYAWVNYTLAAGQHVETLATASLAGTGTINLAGNERSQRVIGNNGNNSLYGNAGNDQLYGYGGNDLLNGGAGIDQMSGGLGDDRFYVDSASDRVFEASGQGNDAVYAWVNYTLAAGQHVETLATASLAGTGTINLAGNERSQRVIGNNGNNSLYGNAGNDQLYGYGGNDLLNGGAGIDQMSGGLGDDRFYVDSASDRVFEASGQGNDAVYAWVNYTLAAGQHVETLATASLAGTGTINLAGNERSQRVIGNNGNNSLYGNAGNDQLYGYGGNDLLNGGAGVDQMSGGLGDDRFYVDSASDRVFEASGQGNDAVYAWVSYTLAAGQHVETLATTSLAGTGTIDLAGNERSQRVIGNNGNNSLYGNAGNDQLYGYGGNDTLVGGTGNDTLTGGAGNDYFVFNTALTAAPNVDRITDFNIAADTIRLDNAVMPGLGSGTGTLAAGKFWKSTSGLAHDADDRIIYETDTGRLFYDSNGSAAGGSVHFATLAPNLGLTHADFQVI